METELRGLAGRARRGAPREARDRLLETLWPWALRTARTCAARLPPGADRDAVHSEVLWEVFQAVRRMDWERYDVWPALLKARLRNAWSTAARAADPLTRGERRARSAYLARVEAETQRLRRSLTPAERFAIARRVSPRGGVVPVVLGRSLLTADQDAAAQGAVETSGDTDGDPAVLAQRALLRWAVRTWVVHDLPPELSREVTAALERDEGDRLGPALLRRLGPHRASLHRRLEKPI
ncbi:hypothetical protein GCM10010420_21910 [Streptomyces glaucosporus]|uniref:Uncharacterized protein n=1 Tax=Streptomyces glaucosporus TaxID=284044 RepID=A0ABP5V7T9_9ACTN